MQQPGPLEHPEAVERSQEGGRLYEDFGPFLDWFFELLKARQRHLSKIPEIGG